MRNMDIKNIFFSGIVIVALALGIFSIYDDFNNKNLVKQIGKDLPSKFALLSTAKTNSCSGPGFISLKENDDRLQGSCCSAMNFHRYEEQIKGLEKFSGIDKIPQDPYDISVSLAKELLDYQKNIKLTAEQQAVYDKAIKLSHEGGPCCCKCWRWYAFEGLAKYLITEYGFNSEQIAEIWDLEDGCGGSGHTGHGEIERDTFEPSA
jgi:hypothetical protein